jgi:acetyl/propionyl-CoA carboxylase alpha subunit
MEWFMEQRMKRLRIEVEGRTIEGRAVFNKGSLWVHMDGETFVYKADISQSRGRRDGVGKGAHAGEIMAPMPGKIIKVMARAKETVAEGQVLVVMEAMKMEYTLKAQAGGRVADIKAKPGDQVVLGQVLLTLDLDTSKV